MVFTGRRCGGSPDRSASSRYNAPRIRPNEPADGAQKRCLSGSGTPEQDKQLVSSDGQVQPVQSQGGSIADGQAGDRQQSCRRSGRPRCVDPRRRERLQPQLPALKRAHRRVRARSAAGADGPMVKNRCMTASGGKMFGSFSSSGRTSTRVAGIAFG